MVNYGYFRHRFDAHMNAKLNDLADEMGVIIYGYYYTLVELYGAKYAAGHNEGSVEIHARVIANVWRKRVDSCHLVLTKLQLSGLLVFTKCKNTYSLSIPNFAKYYGSYKKTGPSTPSNKSKVKKSKDYIVDEKSSEKDDTTRSIVNYLNESLSSNYRPTAGVTKKYIHARLTEGFNFEDFKSVIDNKKKDWFYSDSMKKFLRPQTLFGNKFESYLNQVAPKHLADLIAEAPVEVIDESKYYAGLENSEAARDQLREQRKQHTSSIRQG